MSPSRSSCSEPSRYSARSDSSSCLSQLDWNLDPASRASWAARAAGRSRQRVVTRTPPCHGPGQLEGHRDRVPGFAGGRDHWPGPGSGRPRRLRAAAAVRPPPEPDSARVTPGGRLIAESRRRDRHGDDHCDNLTSRWRLSHLPRKCRASLSRWRATQWQAPGLPVRQDGPRNRLA